MRTCVRACVCVCVCVKCAYLQAFVSAPGSCEMGRHKYAICIIIIITFNTDAFHAEVGQPTTSLPYAGQFSYTDRNTFVLILNEIQRLSSAMDSSTRVWTLSGPPH